MSAYPVDPGQAIRWTKCPGYTTRLLDLVHRLDPVDRTLLFTTKGKGKQSIVADITDGLFTTGPHPDHSRVEKQRASVQRRINQYARISPSQHRRARLKTCLSKQTRKHLHVRDPQAESRPVLGSRHSRSVAPFSFPEAKQAGFLSTDNLSS